MSKESQQDVPKETQQEEAVDYTAMDVEKLITHFGKAEKQSDTQEEIRQLLIKKTGLNVPPDYKGRKEWEELRKKSPEQVKKLVSESNTDKLQVLLARIVLSEFGSAKKYEIKDEDENEDTRTKPDEFLETEEQRLLKMYEGNIDEEGNDVTHLSESEKRMLAKEKAKEYKSAMTKLQERMKE